MKTISLPASALQALINTGECEVLKPVAKSPAILLDPIECGWYFAPDKYGYETEREVYGFVALIWDDPRLYCIWRFPWGGPAEYVQIKDSRRRCEIMAVEVQAARKRYQWVFILKLIE